MKDKTMKRQGKDKDKYAKLQMTLQRENKKETKREELYITVQ